MQKKSLAQAKKRLVEWRAEQEQKLTKPREKIEKFPDKNDKIQEKNEETTGEMPAEEMSEGLEFVPRYAQVILIYL